MAGKFVLAFFFCSFVLLSEYLDMHQNSIRFCIFAADLLKTIVLINS